MKADVSCLRPRNVRGVCRLLPGNCHSDTYALGLALSLPATRYPLPTRDPRHVVPPCTRAVLCASAPRRRSRAGIYRAQGDGQMKRVWIVAGCAAAAAACEDRGDEVLALRGAERSMAPRDSVDAAHETLLAESMAVMEFVGELNNELARAGRLRLELGSGAAGES